MSSKGKSSAASGGKAAFLPKARFPEFQTAGAWENKPLAPFLRDCSGRVPSNTSLPVFSSTRDGLRRQDTYFDGRVLQNNNDYGVVPPGCFVYRHMSDDGTFKFNINDTGGDIAVSKEYPVFETVGLDSKFLLEVLNESQEFKSFALSQKAGGTRTRLYFNRLREWRIALPTLSEQQKIAACLDSADTLIAAQGRKVEALKAHKKGLMQQLFLQDGETQPRLRFPEFEGAGDWALGTVGSVCTSFSGGTPSTSNPEFYGGDIPFIRSAEIGKATTELSLTREGLENSAAKMIKKGDVLVALYGANSGDVAIARISGAINQAILCLRPSGNGAFLAQFLTHRKDWIITKYLQGGQGNLSGEIVKSVALGFPSPKEQQRIADCLTSLDDLIAAEARKLETLKTHKKGLMQQLFPQVGED